MSLGNYATEPDGLIVRADVHDDVPVDWQNDGEITHVCADRMILKLFGRLGDKGVDMLGLLSSFVNGVIFVIPGIFVGFVELRFVFFFFLCVKLSINQLSLA